MRILLQEETVGIGARIAFIRIRNYEFLRRILLRNSAPFPAGREARTTPPAQARMIDLSKDLFRLSEERGVER